MTAVAFVCPACRGPVAREADAYVCAACPRRYPIVLGIPDFRLRPDPWISIEDDRAKGVALDARGHVLVDAQQQTNVPGITAVGDVTDRLALTPVAIAAARALMRAWVR